MNRLAVAKRRSSRRRHEGGAAMFIVAMTIAVLASVGMYALAASSLEVRTSGNERQNTQTHYLAQYGVLGTSHEMTATKGQWYLGLMLGLPDFCPQSLPYLPGTMGVPLSTPAPDPLTKACRRLGSAELGQAWTPGAITQAYTAQTPYAQNTPPGSFGPTPMNGDFFVELSDPLKANAPTRYDTSLNFCFVVFTASANGITQPLFPSIGNPATGVVGGEGVEMQRARLVVGPIQCPR